MMKNPAGWLALLVLAIATLLMVFFVLPRISDDRSPVGEAVTAAGDAVKDAAEQTGEAASSALDQIAGEARAATEKMGRLSAAANTAVSELTDLFADGRTPASDAFDAARSKAEAAVGELAEIDVPDTLDAATMQLLTAARESAASALSFIRSLPADPSAAGSLIGRLAAILNGSSDAAASPDAEPAAAPADQASIGNVPAFDILRVEPDGSTVIAGTAEPGSRIEILSADTVVAVANVGSSGDFAAVLDRPLPPGDHQLLLKATGQDGQSLISEEIATISVPRENSSDLLAMVTKPGKASRLINVPGSEPQAETRVATTETGEPAMPELPAGAADLSGSAPAIATEGAAAPAETPAQDTTQQPAETQPAAEVQVTAVEIEGDRIFVAGMAPAGSKVRAYANDALIGESTTEGNGHFVIDGIVPLAVGNHTIRVDQLGADGNVAVRVSVPFNRPEGNQIAVVTQPTDRSGEAISSPTDETALAKLGNEALRAFNILRGIYENGRTPGTDEVMAARSGLAIALKSMTEFRLPETATAEAVAATKKISDSAASALALLDAMPRDVKAFGEGLESLGQRMAAAFGVSPEEAVTATETAAGPRTIEQAPLAENKNAIIIRRGDTLWQISRRVYGQGVRYTTIYLANQDQITNPDRILPGQIFGVPDEALPNAEELHRQRLSGQASQ